MAQLLADSPPEPQGRCFDPCVSCTVSSTGNESAAFPVGPVPRLLLQPGYHNSVAFHINRVPGPLRPL